MLECRPTGFSLYMVLPCIGELISMVPDLVTAFDDFHLQSFASGFGWALTGTPLVRPVLVRCGRPHSLGRSNPGHVVKPLAPSCRWIYSLPPLLRHTVPRVIMFRRCVRFGVAL